MSLKVRELIKKVRASKTAEEERSVINKESAEIRNMPKVKNIIMENKGNKIKRLLNIMLYYRTYQIQLKAEI
jgi:hypothetical protein